MRIRPALMTAFHGGEWGGGGPGDSLDLPIKTEAPELGRINMQKGKKGEIKVILKSGKIGEGGKVSHKSFKTNSHSNIYKI